MLLRAHLNRRYSFSIPLETDILGIETVSSRWQQFGQSIYPRQGDEAGVIRGFGVAMDINSYGVRLIVGSSNFNLEEKITDLRHQYRQRSPIYGAGIARVYEYNRGNWIKLGNDILGDKKGQLLGASVAMNDYGNVVAVGSPDDNLNGRVYRDYPNVIWQKLSNYRVDPGSEYGSVKVLTYIPSITSSWIQLGNIIKGERENSNPYDKNRKPIGSDRMADHLGLTLKMNMSGNRIAIGYSKGVRVYELDPLSASSITAVTSATSIELLGSYKWYKLGPDIITNTEHGDRYIDINASGDSIIVGQVYSLPYKVRGGKIDPGAAKVYKYNSSVQTWAQVGSDLKVPGTENMNSALNGMSVSMNHDGKIVAVGAPLANLSNGALTKVGLVQVFSLSGGNKWVALGPAISGYNNTPGSYCGYSVSLNAAGNILSVGSPGVDVDGNALIDDKPRGLVQMFIWSGTGWKQVGNNITQSPHLTGFQLRDKYGNWYDSGYGRQTLISDSGDKIFISAPGYEKVRDPEKIKPSGLVETYNIVNK